MKILFYFIITVFLAINVTVGQVSHGGQPVSWSKNMLKELAPLNIELDNTLYKQKSVDNVNVSLEFAYVISVDFSSDTHGEKVVLDNGDKVWRLHLKSENAYSLNFTFSQFYIPTGAEVFVYSPDRTELLGAFTSENQKLSGKLAIAPIKGDELIIEYNEPKDVDFTGVLEIQSIGHDYKNIFGTKDGYFGRSGDCNIDINCTEGDDWQIEKRAVCRMIINNSLLCTGVLVNNTQEDATPYLLSANHCVEDNYSAENTIFFFNYESPTCGGDDGNVSHTLSGAQLLATKNEDNIGFLDFTLMQLSVKVPRSYNPYFAGWNANGDVPNSSACIHHPWADVKKISIDNEAPIIASYSEYGYDEDTFLKVLEWDAGTTEKGSSGSPLFDQNHKIVGTLSGGEASCGNPVNDLFQMFAASYNSYSADTLQLQKWLDPLNSGVSSLDGYSPYGDVWVHNIDAFYHFDPAAQAAAYSTPDGGYVSGNNEYADLSKAEFFNLKEFGDRTLVTGGFVYFFKATGNDDTEVEIFIADENNGQPGNILGTATLKMAEIKQDVENKLSSYFEFFDPILLTNSVYIGVNLPQNDGDTIAILNSVDTPEINTAWEQNSSSQWLAYSSESSWGSNFVNYMAVEAGWLVDVKPSDKTEYFVKLFPNPVNSELSIVLQENENIEQLSVFNTMGQLVFAESNSDSFENINVTDWLSGLYIVRIKTQKGMQSARFIVKH